MSIKSTFNTGQNAQFALSILLAGGIIIVGLVSFISFTSSLQNGDLAILDHEINSWLHTHRTSSINAVMKGITQMGNVIAYVIIIPIIALLLFRYNKNWQHSIETAIILISCFLVNLGLKFHFARSRPDVSLHLVELAEDSFSYPSGHSMTAMAFYGFLMYLSLHYFQAKYTKLFSVLVLSALIFLIGISRVYLGAHYPTDVLAGFLVGLVWLLICINILRYFQFKKLRSH